jgi:hypothetical protein
MADADFPLQPTPKEFLRELHRLHRMSGSKSEREMFRDFSAMAFYAHAKKMSLFRGDDDRAEQQEDAYMKIVGTYRNKDVVRGYPKLMAMAMVGVNFGEDFLGTVAAELNVLDQRNGQYFTPMSVCMMMARMALDPISMKETIEESGYITMGEPCAGSGAMVIGMKRNLEYEGFDPLQHMLVHATELNQLSYWMCYLQMTWAGIPGLVIHGNSLSLERFDAEFTLPTLEFTKHHDTLFEKHPKSDDVNNDEKPNRSIHADVELPRTNQLSLFNFD